MCHFVDSSVYTLRSGQPLGVEGRFRKAEDVKVVDWIQRPRCYYSFSGSGEWHKALPSGSAVAESDDVVVLRVCAIGQWANKCAFNTEEHMGGG